MSDNPVNVVSLAAERSRRDAPDPEFARHDEYGRPLYTFGVEYEFEGRQYSFHLIAYSFEDAEAKLAAMQAGGMRVFGQIMAVVPA